MEFHASPTSSIGIEIEWQLLDAHTLDLVDGILPLLGRHPQHPSIQPEYSQSTVEINSRPCATIQELEADITTVVADLQARCQALGMVICGAGTHPFCDRPATITPLPRYIAQHEGGGYLADLMMTYALHVHVGMPSGDTAIAVMTALKPYLPILLALSASSPFWQGIDTDYASFRQRILASMRSYGQPPVFATWQEFVELFQAGKEAGMFDIIRDIHWDLRPQPDLGTLEIRVMDSQPTIREAIALTALVHSLVVALQHGHLQGKSDFRLTPCHSWIEKENYFQASYQGLDACYIENNRGSHRPIAAIAQDILQALEPTANQLGESAHLKFLADRLASGPSYCRQRRVFQQTGAKKAVVASLVRELLEETCPRLDDFPAIAVEPVFPPNGLQPSPSVLE